MKRFAIYNQPVIGQAPLQVYSSALIFAPLKSIVRRQFEGSIPGWIARVPQVAETWSAELVTLEGHSKLVSTVVFSPDGKRLASVSDDGTVRLWDVKSCALQTTLVGHNKLVKTVVFSPNGKRLASASDDSTVRLWDVVSGTEVATLKCTRRMTALAITFSPDGTRLALAVAFLADSYSTRMSSAELSVTLLDSKSGVEFTKLVLPLKGSSDTVYIDALAFSPDSTQLVSTFRMGTVTLWDVKSGAEVATFESHRFSNHKAMAFSPDGTRLALASASACGTLRLLDVGSGAEIATLKHHDSDICLMEAVKFSPDGMRLVSVSNHFFNDAFCTVRLWDSVSGIEVATLKGHGGFVFAVAFSPDSMWLASASADGTVRLWDGVLGTELTMLKGYGGSVRAVAFSQDGIEPVSVKAIVFSPDGTLLASASADGTVRLWDTLSVAGVAALESRDRFRGYVHTVVFSPDGKRLASAAADDMVRLWDVDLGTEVATLGGHGGYVHAIAFSPDSTRLASVSNDGTIRLWGTESGAEVATLLWVMPVWRELELEACLDSTRLASVPADDTIRLWGGVSGIEVVTLSWSNWVKCLRQELKILGLEEGLLDRYVNAINAIAFSREGMRLALATVDGAVRPWDAVALDIFKQAAKQTVELSLDNESPVSSSVDSTVRLSDSIAMLKAVWRKQTLELSSDGEFLASASADGMVRLWDGKSGEEEVKVAFSLDGRRVALAEVSVTLLDGKSGAEIATLAGHAGSSIKAVAFSPDGTRLAPAADDGTVGLWDSESGTGVATLKGHDDWVFVVAFSPDGMWLASASADGTVRLWDAELGTALKTLQPGVPIHQLSFSIDGSYLKTSRGIIRLKIPDRTTTKKLEQPDLFVSDQWITTGGEKFFWLPAEYRATCVALEGQELVLGHSSGRVSLFRFDTKVLNSLRL